MVRYPSKFPNSHTKLLMGRWLLSLIIWKLCLMLTTWGSFATCNSRARKIKCDGAKPVCHNCTHRSSSAVEGILPGCNYDAAPKRRGPDVVDKTWRHASDITTLPPTTPPPFQVFPPPYHHIHALYLPISLKSNLPPYRPAQFLVLDLSSTLGSTGGEEVGGP